MFIKYSLKLENENEFNLNPIFQPNPNQLERYEKELERLKKESKENLSKIKLGLQRINKAYENKQWKNEEEELFLELFYKSEVKVDLKEYPNYILIIKNNINIVYQDLKNKIFWIDYKSIWKVFEDEFHWNVREIQSFMKIMLNEYFKLRDYIPFLYS